MLPADYVIDHVELAYASTAYGVQGETVPAAHVVIGNPSGAASVYVGMTRGRGANTAHLVAADVAEARGQWIAAFGRDRADLGPGHAAVLAAREAARYAPTEPPTRFPVTRRRFPLPPRDFRRPEAGPGPFPSRRRAAPGIGR